MSARGHSHSLDVSLSGGPRQVRRPDPMRTGGGVLAVVAVVALFAGGDSVVDMQPRALVFNPAQPAGSTSPAQAIALTNRGTVPVPIARLALSNAASFSIAGTTCGEGLVRPGEPCEVRITFHPAVAGPFTGILQDRSGGPRVELSGQGLPPQVVTLEGPAPPVPEVVPAPAPEPEPEPLPAPAAPPASAAAPPPVPSPVSRPAPDPPGPAPDSPRPAPSSPGNPAPAPSRPDPEPTGPPTPPPAIAARFGAAEYTVQAEAGQRGRLDAILANTGNAPIAGVQLRLEGADPGAFSVPPSTCPQIAPGARCSIAIDFEPRAAGTATAALIAAAGGLPLADTRLVGTVRELLQPRADIRPARLQFERRDQELALLVRNVGSAPLTLEEFTVDRREFEVRPEECARTRTLSPGGQCRMAIRFRGRADAAAMLTIRHTDPQRATSVALVADVPRELLSVPRLPRSPEAAVRRIDDEGFAVGNRVDRASCEPAGTVIGQNPAAGTQAPAGSPIDMVIASAGPRPATVPDVRNHALAEAEKMIQAVGLLPRRGDGVETDRVRAGVVVDVQPPVGTVMAPEGCRVTLTVTRPVVRVAVPTLVGMPLAAAKRELGTGVLGAVIGQLTGFRLGTVRTERGEPVPAGQDDRWVVSAQTPQPGQQVPRSQGTTIDLTVRPLKQEPTRPPITAVPRRPTAPVTRQPTRETPTR